MKKKLIVILLSICICITGCAAKSAINESDIQTAENRIDNIAGKKTEAAEAAKPQSEQHSTDTVQNEDDLIYKDTVLTMQAPPQQVCIVVQPSVLRTYSFYYYTPDKEAQEWLQQYMDTMSLEGRPYEGKWVGLKETGWQIAYQDKCFMVFEGGYLEYSYLDENGGLMEYFVEAPALCDYIQIMLQEKLDYTQFNPADIKNIISAKLDVHSIFTNHTFYSQTITDAKTLKVFEDWFCNAEYIWGGADCGNQDACLELTLDGGEIVRLSVATDSCSNFGINGLYYDYRPTSSWDNREFFNKFDEIPWNWTDDCQLPNWGLSLSVDNITASGLTLICTQSGGELTGELQTGSEYKLLVLKDGIWSDMPTVIDQYAWTAVAYPIAKGESREFDIEWEWLYGELPSGTYRLTKTFMDFRDSGNYDNFTYWTEFDVK